MDRLPPVTRLSFAPSPSFVLARLVTYLKYAARLAAGASGLNAKSFTLSFSLAALSPAFVLVALLSACGDEQPAAPAQANSRVNAVAAARNPHEVEAFCDVRFAANDARRASATGAYSSMPASDKWRWVNVWATWCRPCVEELPLVARFTQKLGELGAPVETTFLSVDASDDVVAAYAATRPEVRGSARLPSPAELPSLMTALGLDPGATIPIHAFYDPAGQLRCVRTGAVHEADLSILRRVMLGE